jgi:hypothetical protein
VDWIALTHLFPGGVPQAAAKNAPSVRRPIATPGMTESLAAERKNQRSRKGTIHNG